MPRGDARMALHTRRGKPDWKRHTWQDERIAKNGAVADRVTDRWCRIEPEPPARHQGDRGDDRTAHATAAEPPAKSLTT